MVKPARTILILGLGEGGSYLARALRDCAAGPGPRVLAYDAAIARPELADDLRRRAADLGVELKEDLGPWAAEAEVAVSLVPGTVALAVAQSVRPHLRPGAIFVDLNSITASMMREVAAVFEASGIEAGGIEAGGIEAGGIDVVDGGVLGNFRAGNRVPVLLAGARADAVRDFLPDQAFIAESIEGRPGDASAIKMLRSVLMKGLEALFVECLVAAEIQGLRPTLLKAFRDLDERPFAKTMEVQTVTHLVHAARRLKEVERVASVLEADGLEGIMTEATRRTFAATVAAGVAPGSGEPLSLDETLQVLTGVFRKIPA